MKVTRLFSIALAVFAAGLFATAAHAERPTLSASIGYQAGGGIEANLSWTAPTCAAAIGTTNGVETSGPCYGLVYRATVTQGAACPAFSTSAYTAVTSTAPVTSTAAKYSDLTVVANSTYCFAVEDQFQIAGGAVTSPSNTFQLFAILPGTPGAPTGLVVVSASN